MDKESKLGLLGVILLCVVIFHIFTMTYTYEDVISTSSNIGDKTVTYEIATKDWRGHIIEVHNETVEVEKVVKYRDYRD